VLHLRGSVSDKGVKSPDWGSSLITGFFFICLRIFDKLFDCFLRFRYMCVLISCWRPNLVLFSYFWLWFFLILSLPFVLVWQKGGVFLSFLDRECISKPVKCFLSQNGQRGSLLVFYVGYILDDKNTLCNGCIWTRWSVLIQSLHIFEQCSFPNMWLITSF